MHIVYVVSESSCFAKIRIYKHLDIGFSESQRWSNLTYYISFNWLTFERKRVDSIFISHENGLINLTFVMATPSPYWWLTGKMYYQLRVLGIPNIVLRVQASAWFHFGQLVLLLKSTNCSIVQFFLKTIVSGYSITSHKIWTKSL